MVSVPTCAASYNVVGAIYDGEETESILGNVFTDSDPFECELALTATSVDFNFNSTATDPVTGCTYDLEREEKDPAYTLGSRETVDCDRPQIHYGVIATPQSGPACLGLSVIDVDPKLGMSSNTGGTQCQ